MLPSIPEPQENESESGQQTPGESSERSGSSNWQNDGESGSETDNESQSAFQSKENDEGPEESSDSDETFSAISSSSLGQGSRKRRATPSLKGSSFGGAVCGLVDLVQCSLHALQPPGPRPVTSICMASPEPVEDSELPRVPSLRTLLKFPDEDENQVAGEEIFAERSQRSEWKDGHGRVRHNMNIVSFETLALGVGRDKSNRQTELQKSWGEIAGKLAFVLTKVDQVVPMSKATLLNEALGGQSEDGGIMSDESRQLLEMILQSKKFLGSAFHSLLESDPVKVLKDSLEARLNSGPGGGLFAQQEELSAYEKDINVRENLLDNPEFIDMMLQRWFAQKGFCVSNVAERRYLAEEFWKIQRARAKKKNKRLLQGASAKSMRSSLSLEAFQATLSMQSEQEQDLSTERGIKMEIKRAMTKLKRKCRVLEGQWVEQPRMMLPRLERQCRSLRTKVEDKFQETETTRKKLCEADARWQRNRDGYEPTLVDLELQAWDTRVDLAKSVIRWVRRDRKEAQVEWQARMAKYHSDKKRMRGNFDYAVRRWRTDGSWGPGCNPWKAGLAFISIDTSRTSRNAESDDRKKVQIEQGLVISGLTRPYLINQEKLLDNPKRPLGNSWELLRRQYVNYCRIVEGQLEHWLQGEFLGPVLRKVRDLAGHLNSFVQEVLQQLESLIEGVDADLRMPNLQVDSSRPEGVGRKSIRMKDTNRADVRMEDALTAVLVHAEKERNFLDALLAFDGELRELGRCQAELSRLATRRPFTFQDLCGETIRRGGSQDLPPISFHQLEQGIEAPAKAARLLARLVQINWTTYLLKWEILITKYKTARDGYVDHLDKIQEASRQQLMKDLKENPKLTQDLLRQSRSRTKEAEDRFYATHVQPEVLRCHNLSQEVADFGTQLHELKNKTRALEQDVALNFARSLELESAEDLLKRYQTDYEMEAARSQQLNQQLNEAKERQRLAKENSKPSILQVMEAHRVFCQLDEKAEEQMRHMFLLNEVLDAKEVSPQELENDLRARGLQATSTSRDLLRILKSLWPDEVTEVTEDTAREDTAHREVESTTAKDAGLQLPSKVVQPVPLVPLLQPAKDFSVQEAKVGTEIVSERPKDSKDIQRRLSWRLPSGSSSSLTASLASDEDPAKVTTDDLDSRSEVRPCPPEIVTPAASEIATPAAPEIVTPAAPEIVTPAAPEAKNIIQLTHDVDVDQSSEKQHLDYADSMVRTGGDLPESINELSTDQETREITNAQPDPASVPQPATSMREPIQHPAAPLVRMESVELPEVTEAPSEKIKTRAETQLDSRDTKSLLIPGLQAPSGILRQEEAKSPRTPERRLMFNIEEEVSTSKLESIELPVEAEEMDPEPQEVHFFMDKVPAPPGPAPKQRQRPTPSKAKVQQNSVTEWMQEVSRALLTHTTQPGASSLISEEEQQDQQTRTSASLKALLHRKRRRGLAPSLWPELAVGTYSSPTRKGAFSGSQPLRTKIRRLLPDTPDLQLDSIHAIIEAASPASLGVGRATPTGRLWKRSVVKANTLSDLSQGKAPTSPQRLSLGRLCTGSKSGTSHFRDQLSTRSFHGSNGLKLDVGPGLEAYLWGQAVRPRGEWRSLLQPENMEKEEKPSFSGLNRAITTASVKEEKPAIRSQTRRRKLYEVGMMANRKTLVEETASFDFTVWPASRNSKSD